MAWFCDGTDQQLQAAGAKEQPIGPMLESFVREARSHVLLTTPSVRYKTEGTRNPHWEDR
jgi:hypothetical protein